MREPHADRCPHWERTKRHTRKKESWRVRRRTPNSKVWKTFRNEKEGPKAGRGWAHPTNKFSLWAGRERRALPGHGVLKVIDKRLRPKIWGLTERRVQEVPCPFASYATSPSPAYAPTQKMSFDATPNRRVNAPLSAPKKNRGGFDPRLRLSPQANGIQPVSIKARAIRKRPRPTLPH